MEREQIIITKEDLDKATTLNVDELGVIKYWREDRENGTQKLIIGLFGDSTGFGGVNFLGKSFENLKRDESLVNQTGKAEHLNAYKIYAEMNSLDARNLTDAQAVESLARFSINWSKLRADAFRDLEGYDLGSERGDIDV